MSACPMKHPDELAIDTLPQHELHSGLLECSLYPRSPSLYAALITRLYYLREGAEFSKSAQVINVLGCQDERPVLPTLPPY